jgi:hypothetical protein
MGYYSLDYTETQAGALAGRFSGEKGIKDFIKVLALNAGASISESKFNKTAFYFAGYGKAAVFLTIGGLDCVFNQREEYLLDVIFNRMYRG